MVAKPSRLIPQTESPSPKPSTRVHSSGATAAGMPKKEKADAPKGASDPQPVAAAAAAAVATANAENWVKEKATLEVRTRPLQAICIIPCVCVALHACVLPDSKDLYIPSAQTRDNMWFCP